MARKKRSPPSGDGAGPSRSPKRAKSTSRSVGPTSGFSENATGSSRLELENRKIEELQLALQETEEKLKVIQTEFNKGKEKLKVIQTEVNKVKEKLSILQNHPDANQSESERVDHGRYEIRIIGAIRDRVHTGSIVKRQDGGLLKVAICYNDEKVTWEPFASAEFEILVMKGDFCAEGSWTAETFQGSLVEAREEVGSILKNNSISKFDSGEAVLGGLKFIDNSSWVKGKKWRLGIRLLKSNGVRVVEAISNCFRVLDRHGKASEKPHPPLLTDGVECLEKVGKKRALDLKYKKICTVKDFLQLFHSNQSRLLKILGINSESDESWKTMIRHAKECNVGSNLYSYRKNNSMLFFDSVYDLVGAEFGNRYRSFDKLKDSRKTLVNKWKKGFYRDINTGNIADFEMTNGQPVPIEQDSTSISADGDAQQKDGNSSQVQEQESASVPLTSTENMSVEEPYQDLSSQRAIEGRYDPEDRTMHIIPSPGNEVDYHLLLRTLYDLTAEPLDRQPADNTHSLSYDAVPYIRRDADQNIVSDHNAGENYSLTQDENLSLLQEQSGFVPLSSTVEINSTSAHENMLVEASYQSLSYPMVNIEGRNDLEDITMHFIPSPGHEADFQLLLRTFYENFLYGKRNIAKARVIIKARCSVVWFTKYLRRDNLAGNGQPVPIEHDSTSISADGDAQQKDENLSQVQEQESASVPLNSTMEINSISVDENFSVEEPYQGLSSQRLNIEVCYNPEDRTMHIIPSPRNEVDYHLLLRTLRDLTAEPLDRQPADNTHSLSYDVVPDIRRGTDQNIVSDCNAGENYDLTQEFPDENLSQLQGQSASVPLSSIVEINSTSAHENMLVEASYQDLSSHRVNIEVWYDPEDRTMHIIPLPGNEADYHLLLRTLYGKPSYNSIGDRYIARGQWQLGRAMSWTRGVRPL